MSNIRIVIADPNAIWSEGLRAIFERENGLEVVGMASDGKTAWQLIVEKLPDVILIDVDLSAPGSLKITEEIRKQHLPISVFVTAFAADEHQVIDALLTGTNGYLLKSISIDQLVLAARTARARDSIILEQPIAKFVQNLAIGIAKNGLDSERHKKYKNHDLYLSPSVLIEHGVPERILGARELEVLQLVADGMTNKQIASKLKIAERTVQAHISSIFTKLHVNSRTEAVLQALDRGWMSLKKEHGTSPFGL